MIHDINQYGVMIQPKANTTLKNMTKAELIEYIRTLEYNYNVAVDFNERQARNIEQMIKDGRLTEVIRCKDCLYELHCENAQYLGTDGYCSHAEFVKLEGVKE